MYHDQHDQLFFIIFFDEYHKWLQASYKNSSSGSCSVMLQYDVHTGKVLCIFSGLRSFEERAVNGYNVTRQAVPGFNFRK